MIVDKPESKVPSPKPEVLNPKSESKIGVQSPKSELLDWGCHNNHTTVVNTLSEQGLEQK